MGVSKNRGTPKWMVKTMENPIKMDDLGISLFSETSISLKMKETWFPIVVTSSTSRTNPAKGRPKNHPTSCQVQLSLLHLGEC